MSEPSTVQFFEDKWNDCSIRYGDLKKQLAADICKVTLPIRERIESISSDADYLHKVTEMGREKARASAQATLALAKEAIGLKRF